MVAAEEAISISIGVRGGRRRLGLEPPADYDRTRCFVFGWICCGVHLWMDIMCFNNELSRPYKCRMSVRRPLQIPSSTRPTRFPTRPLPGSKLFSSTDGQGYEPGRNVNGPIPIAISDCMIFFSRTSGHDPQKALANATTGSTSSFSVALGSPEVNLPRLNTVLGRSTYHASLP